MFYINIYYIETHCIYSRLITECVSCFSVPETDGDTDNDLDNDNVFGSNLVPPTFPIEEKHRRATVSGASPIVQRPSIRINELASGRPKSYTISSPSSDGSLGSPGSEVASPQNDNAPADKTSTGNKSFFLYLLCG